MPNHYVGHPLADKLSNEPHLREARIELNLPLDKTVVALLPGSRLTEIKKIAGPLLKAAEISQRENNNLYFISGLLDKKSLKKFEEIKNRLVPDLNIDICVGKTHRVMEAADIIMLASGTATLEAMLLKKPMVVAYRLSC